MKAANALLVVATIFLIGAAHAVFAKASDQQRTRRLASPELNRLVRDVCHKSVVLLGEDANHGAANTLEIKVDLVRRLIDECGYSEVFFESQVYDFLDLEAAFASHKATPERLADAVGGLWSTTREFEPLQAFLFAQAASGRVRLMGLDPRLGEATALFARERLPPRLVRRLPEPRRDECAVAIQRNANWLYDDANPYGPDAVRQLKSCAEDIRSAYASREGEVRATREDVAMAMNFSSYVEIIADEENSWERRDRAMADNFLWAKSRLPKQAKVIVWCATVHAAKQLPVGSKQRESMGSYLHRSLGDSAAVIGFTARSGRVSRLGASPKDIPRAASDSIESRALAGSSENLRYFDRQQLHALGNAPAHPIDFGQVQAADWSTVLDGLLVLREERPLVRVRPAKPQQ